MLFTKKTAAEKRQMLRDGIASGKILQAPGAFSPMVAMEIEQTGFPVVYVSGAVLAADLGLPDIGLTTLTEVAQRGQQIARVTDLPVIIDCDTGFGEPMSAARTIQIMEEAGLSGCHLEDQINPKRCGHLDHKSICSKEDMVRRLSAAVQARKDPNFLIIARTDARAVEGIDATIDRIKAYVEAGADMIFPEALKDLSEFDQIRKAVDIPMLANMTEFGKSELFDAADLEVRGFNMVIYPVTTWRLALGATVTGLQDIKEKGHQRDVVSLMQTRADLYETLRYPAYNQFDQSIFNFGETPPEEWQQEKKKEE